MCYHLFILNLKAPNTGIYWNICSLPVKNCYKATDVESATAQNSACGPATQNAVSFLVLMISLWSFGLSFTDIYSDQKGIQQHYLSDFKI